MSNYSRTYTKIMDDLNELYKLTYADVAYCADYVWGKSRNYLQPLWSIKYDASKITDRIYISDLATTFNRERLREDGITHILNLVIGIDPTFPDDFTYKGVPVRDVPDQNLSQYFDECCDFIDNCIERDGKILVHCSHGVSRSATVVISYLIKRAGMSFDEAYAFVKERRPVIEPNDGFKAQLRLLSKGT